MKLKTFVSWVGSFVGLSRRGKPRANLVGYRIRYQPFFYKFYQFKTKSETVVNGVVIEHEEMSSLRDKIVEAIAVTERTPIRVVGEDFEADITEDQIVSVEKCDINELLTHRDKRVRHLGAVRYKTELSENQ